MKTFLALILLVCIGVAFAEVDSSACDVVGLSGLASSACSEDCENQAECANALALLTSEAERCGCDSECQKALDESRLVSARCEAEEDEEDDETEDDDEDEIDEIDELDKKKKKKKKKKSKGKKKGKKGNKKAKKWKKKVKKWMKKLKQCRAISSASGGSKAQCVSCCVKNIVLYAVTEEFDLASVPEDVRRQREQVYEELMNQNVENKMLELVSTGLVEESTEEEDLAELEEDEEDDLEEDDEDEEDDESDEEDEDLEEEDEEDEAEETDELDKKKKKKKKGKKKKNKKKKKKMMKKRKKMAKKACRKQLGLVFAYDLASTTEALTLEQAKESLAIQSLDFEELEEPVEDEEEEEEEELEEDDSEENVDLDELDKKKKKKGKVSKKMAKKAAKKCCASRVKSSSFEHRYVKHF